MVRIVLFLHSFNITWCVMRDAWISSERRAWFVNLWTNERRDLPPEICVTSEFLLSFPETFYTKREIWSWFFLGFVRKTANEFKVIWENEAFKLNHKTYRVNFWCSKKTSTNFHVRTNSLLKTNSVLCSREWLKFKKKKKKSKNVKTYKYTNKKAKKWLLAVEIFFCRKLKMLL